VQATDFEYRHPTLVRHLLIAIAVSTYFFDKDNVVWRFIKESPARTELERGFFLIATFLIGAGAVLCTSARVHIRPERRGQLIGEFVYTAGLSSLMPLSGCILLIVGEALRVLRLNRSLRGNAVQQPSGWGLALRREAAKWGIFVTMIAFTATLTDRLAEYLAAVSVVAWIALNLPFVSLEKVRNRAN
jgi:hypothetical protein